MFCNSRCRAVSAVHFDAPDVLWLCKHNLCFWIHLYQEASWPAKTWEAAIIFQAGKLADNTGLFPANVRNPNRQRTQCRTLHKNNRQARQHSSIHHIATQIHTEFRQTSSNYVLARYHTSNEIICTTSQTPWIWRPAMILPAMMLWKKNSPRRCRWRTDVMVWG